MIGLGTIVNTAAVIAGGACGLLLKKGINERIQETLIKALGTATIFIGISGAMTGMFALKDGDFETTGTMLMIFSLAIGAVLGELSRIEDRMESLGEKLRRLFHVQEGQGFVDGFLTNTLVICIGAILIFLVGVNLLFGKQVRVGNLLPALLVPILYAIINTVFFLNFHVITR